MKQRRRTGGLSAHALASWGGRIRVQVLGDHLLVERIDALSGIPWEVLQAAKDDAFGPDAVAVEIYPRARDAVNDMNRRHLWRVPADLESAVPNLARTDGGRAWRFHPDLFT